MKKNALVKSWMNRMTAITAISIAVVLAGCTAELNKVRNEVAGTTEFKIDPALTQLKAQDWQTFSATNGTSPYVYSVLSGAGSIDAATGRYQAPPSIGTTIIAVTDAADRRSYSTVITFDLPKFSVATKIMALRNSTVLTANGGAQPYTFAIVSGGGTIDAATGAFTAPNAAGTTVVRVTDNSAHSADCVITTNAALSVSPKTAVVNSNSTLSLAAAGGVPPYTYSVTAGHGSITNLAGVFFAPGSVGTEIITVKDSAGNSDVAVVTVTSPLSLSPAGSLIALSTNDTFSAAGGVKPYTYSASVGTIDAATGAFTAPATAGGPYIISVTDALGTTASAELSVTTDLSFSSNSLVLSVNGSHDFSTLTDGGVGAKSYSVAAGQGSFSGSVYTAPSTPGTFIVSVVDSQTPSSNRATTIVRVNPALEVFPSTKTIAVENIQGLSVSGGVPPYAYAITSGGGSISSSGLFTAGSAPGTVNVRVTDAENTQVTAAITVNAKLQISPISAPVVTGSVQAFTATGGVGNKTYKVVSGLGSIDAATGIYQAPHTVGTSLIQVHDELGNVSSAVVTVVSPLIFSPASITIKSASNIVLSAMGGLPPYAYELASGIGAVDSSTGRYQAPTSVGTAVVRVTDQLGGTNTIQIDVYQGLLLLPLAKTMVKNHTLAFSATGGQAPYTYSVVQAGRGTIDPTSGVYTAPGTAGTATVRVTDAVGSVSDASLVINNDLAISPTSLTLAVGNQGVFAASGGVGGNVYSIISGAGAINAHTGDFTAGISAGAVTARVTDSDGSTADAVITVNAALAMLPSIANVGASGAVNIAAVGGVAPYTFSVVRGGGSISASGASAVFTAPAVVAEAVIRVTDTRSNVAESTINVFSSPTIAPLAFTLATNNTTSFSVVGGKAPYTYSVTGGGNIHASTGVYYAPNASGSDTVTVTDSLGQTSSSAVTVNPGVTVSPALSTIAAGGNQALTVAGGAPPYTYLVYSGTGSVISNVFVGPSSGGGTSVVRVTDSLGNYAAASIVTNDVAPASLIYAGGPFTFIKGTAISAVSGTASGGSVISYSIAPSLPAGLGLNATSGEISGTPTAVSAATTYTITASNSGGSTQTTVQMTVNDIAPLTLSYSNNVATYTRGVAIATNSPSNGGGAIVSYAVAPTLPAGLSLNTSTGIISGTPSALVTSAGYVVTGTNSGGQTTATLTLAVADVGPSSLAYTQSNPNYLKGQAISANSPTSSGGAVVSYSVAPPLPAGLTLNTSSGVYRHACLDRRVCCVHDHRNEHGRVDIQSLKHCGH